MEINFKEHKNLVCIYSFRNMINNKRYIGQTINLYRRYHCHRCDCTALKFARAIKKYGFEVFELEILERCNKDELDSKEEHWIAHYDSTNDEFGYNTLKSSKDVPLAGWKAVLKKYPNGYKGEVCWAYGRKHTEEELRKMSESQKGIPNLKSRKTVICFDENMNFVEEYEYAGEAAKAVGCRPDTINKACSRRLMRKGYYWRYKEEVLPLLV